MKWYVFFCLLTIGLIAWNIVLVFQSEDDAVITAQSEKLTASFKEAGGLEEFQVTYTPETETGSCLELFQDSTSTHNAHFGHFAIGKPLEKVAGDSLSEVFAVYTAEISGSSAFLVHTWKKEDGEWETSISKPNLCERKTHTVGFTLYRVTTRYPGY